LRKWIPEDHPVHFILEAIEQLDVSGFKVNQTGSGSGQPQDGMIKKGRSKGVAGRSRASVFTLRTRPQRGNPYPERHASFAVWRSPVSFPSSSS
jgi:hypothetical protein